MSTIPPALPAPATADVEYAEITYEVDDPVATVTLHRPDAMNAWTTRMGAEVRHAVARAEHDPRVVGIVLTGAGRAFCAGADMKGLSALSSGERRAGGTAGDGGGPDDLDVALPEVTDLDGEYTYLLACTKPVVGALNGAVAGMAVPIALSCDVRFMAEDAPLLTAFAQRGLIAEWGLSTLLGRLVGPGTALELLLSSRRVSGAECARLGIVNEALPADQVLERARAWVRDVAERCSPASMAVMKRQVHAQIHAGLGAAEEQSRTLMVESFSRPDFAEGVQSFLEKRPPSFARLGS